jgi:hypothetical protein
MPADPKDLLLADLAHFGESLWRNEEIGEKRLTFFLTLVAAVSAGLTALPALGITAGTVPAASIALLALLLLGLVTYLRMLKRDRVTDQFKATLAHIRAMYISLCGPEDARALAAYHLPAPEPGWKMPSGGFAQTIATINGLLLAALLMVDREGPWWPAAASGLALTVVLWVVAVRSRS